MAIPPQARTNVASARLIVPDRSDLMRGLSKLGPQFFQVARIPSALLTIMARGIVAALLLFGLTPFAGAVVTTFATYIERVGGPDFVFTNNSPTNATFTATSPILFRYLNIPGLPSDLQGNQLATITITRTTSAPATSVGGILTQPFPVVAITTTITRDMPAAEGFGSRTILLQVTNKATLGGAVNSTSGSLNAATSVGETVIFTSDFLTFSPTSSGDLAIALTQITPPLGLSGPSGAPGTFLNSFTAVGSGLYSSDQIPNVSTPTIAKSFSPNPVVAGAVATLTFTLSNANVAPLTNVSFSDTYPAGLFNANPSNVFTNCVGATVQGGVSGGNTIGLSGATIPGANSCTISVQVTSALVSCYTNVSGSINSSQGGGNSASATVCVTAAQSTLTTQASASVPLGGTINDMATISGVNPTGSITFSLFGPNDATCSTPAVFTSTMQVNGNGNYPSAAFSPIAAGTYRWIANYSGDANNSPFISACNAANENVVVTIPLIVTQVPTLGEAALLLLSILVGMTALMALRRGSKSGADRRHNDW
jgi:uncharacterized repeat protein (TIGR01451 family)